MSDLRRRIAVGAALLVFLGFALRFSWLCDDAFIAFRYSRNLAEGIGLRYNPGPSPPVEGYTPFLWVVYGALFERMGVEPGLWSRATSLVSGAVLLLLVARLARRVAHGRRGPDPENRPEREVWAVATAGLVFAASPTVAVWATGGLATMSFALAVFLAYERLCGDPERPRVGQAVLAGAAAVLLRADGIWWAALVGLAGVLVGWSEGRRALRRGAPLFGAGVLAVFGAHVLWRFGYYGDWLPNTARAKVAWSWLLLERGLDYVVSYALTVPAAALVLLASAVPALRRRAGLLGPWLLAAGTFAYAALVGGDFMAMGRFLLPAVPFLAVLAGWLVARVAQGGSRAGRTAALGALAVLLLASLPATFDVSLAPRSLRERFHFRWSHDYETEYAAWRRMDENLREWRELGRAIALYTDGDESLVHTAIGAVGYYSRLTIHDRVGLVNREVWQELEVDPVARRTPGHDRIAPASFFARWRPTYRAARFVDRDEADEASEDPRAELHPFPEGEGFPPGTTLLLKRF